MKHGQVAEPVNEAQLLREVIAGRTEAYGEIFRRHRQRAYGLAFQYTRNKEDALDIVQDAFIRAYKNLHRFDLSKQFGPWLLTIVRNLSVDCIRKRHRQASEELPAALPSGDPRERADRKLLKLEVWQALSRLERPQREIIFLKDYQGHSYAEIAQILEIPLGTVMSRLHHARRKLIRTLKGGVE